MAVHGATPSDASVIDISVPHTTHQAEALVSAQDFVHGLDLHTESSSSRLHAFDRGFSHAGTIGAMGDYGASILADELHPKGKPLMSLVPNEKKEPRFHVTFYLGSNTSIAF